MAVVINEFEVVDTPAPAPSAASDGDSSKPAPTPLEPEDLRQMLAVCAELQLRRLAH
jgi:hypothetical protein